jgi:PTS system mannose-specific IIB component
MPIVLARVDDRLLHGQVLEGWAPHVQADTIAVVSDSVYLEKDRCRLMELITPEHIHFEVLPLADLEQFLSRYSNSRILLLFAGLDEVMSVLEAGVDLGNINIGNLHNVKGGTEITPSVFLNSQDLEMIRHLVQKGVTVEAREVPAGVAVDLTASVQGTVNS